MTTRIIPIHTGFTTSYLLAGTTAILIDAGVPGHDDLFFEGCGRAGVHPRDIALIVVTHGHWDHVGSLATLAHTAGCPVVAARPDASIVASGEMALPGALSPWGWVIRTMLRYGLIRRKAFRPRAADIVLDDPAMELRPYGVAGTVIRTPGHTEGSLSVLLATGEAFVGDLAAGGFPFRFGNGPMAMGDSRAVMRDSLRLLRGRGATKAFPGHGRPFPLRR